MKTITLAAAGDQLGWDFSYETRVVPRGRFDGVLNGDLVIVGSGDPSLDDWDGGAATVFRSWAARLRELGVHEITGRIVGDDRIFSDDGLGSGWMWDDLAFSYSAPASGLQFNEGAAQVVVMPAQPLAMRRAQLAPAYADVALRGSVRTVQPGGGTVHRDAAVRAKFGDRVHGDHCTRRGPPGPDVASRTRPQYFVSAVQGRADRQRNRCAWSGRRPGRSVGKATSPIMKQR